MSEHSMSMENAFYSSFELINLLFEGFSVSSLPGFIGVLIGIASVSILYEGIRQLRDFFLNRFADTRKQSLIYQQQQHPPSTGAVRAPHRKRDRKGSGNSGSSTKRCDSIRYFNINKRSPIDDPGIDDELGGGDAPAHPHASAVLINDHEVSPDPEPGPSCALVPQQLPVPLNARVRVEDLVLATLLHMVYITIGYLLMLAVMTFNVWILVSVTIGVGIGYLVFGTFRRLDHLATHKRITIIECCEDGEGDHADAPAPSGTRATYTARGDSAGPEGPLLRSGSTSVSSSRTSDMGTGGYGATMIIKDTDAATMIRHEEDDDPTDGESRARLMSGHGAGAGH